MAGRNAILSAYELSALTRLFSSSVIQELARKGRSPLLRRLSSASRLALRCSTSARVRDLFETAFTILNSAGRRDEYIYRSALTHKVLLGKHSLRTAAMLSEFRVGNCRADAVILNGSSAAYEIKSERDSLFRLAQQVEQYRRVFASVNVIASDSHIGAISTVAPMDVGILRLNARYQISTEREAHVRPDGICPVAVFDSLRSDEAILILSGLGIEAPNLPNTQLRGAMRALFSDLEPVAVHQQMVETLKVTRDLTPLCELVERLPKSLHAAILSTPIRKADHKRLTDAVHTPLSEAEKWV
ncbi:MAG: sce7726 family protein [Candidatus Hydrogenedentes bacterium]|nr:sce7726 family protein [Candidatus Hydrogenedentota bacterium]